jgi:hypothetical protein
MSRVQDTRRRPDVSPYLSSAPARYLPASSKAPVTLAMLTAPRRYTESTRGGLLAPRPPERRYGSSTAAEMTPANHRIAGFRLRHVHPTATIPTSSARRPGHPGSAQHRCRKAISPDQTLCAATSTPDLFFGSFALKRRARSTSALPDYRLFERR